MYVAIHKPRMLPNRIGPAGSMRHGLQLILVGLLLGGARHAAGSLLCYVYTVLSYSQV